MSEFQNRLSVELPKTECDINILDRENNVRNCKWKPYDPLDYDPIDQPAEGYLGSAIDKSSKIVFHAWQNTGYEFQYFQEL